MTGVAPPKRSGGAGDPPPEAPVGQDFARGIMARSARDAAARMRARAAHVEPLQRPAIGPVAEDRPRRPELSKAHIAMHDVAAHQPELALEIERRMDLPCDHRALEARRPTLDRIDDEI